MIIAFFQNPGAIYNNFGHEKWICYDKRVQKSWAIYKIKRR